MKKILFTLCIIINISSFSQILEPVNWRFYTSIISENEIELQFKASIDEKWHKHEFEGLLSRAIQHEMDHLNGIFIVDRVSEIEKIKYKKELKTIEADSKDYLSRAPKSKEKFVL